MEAFETFEHAGFTIELHYDEDGQFADPRDADNLGTMVCWHPRYMLGDEQVAANGGAVNNVFETETGRTDFRSLEAVARYLILVRGAIVVLPLTLYDHSGLSMRASASPGPFDPGGWDSTFCGFVYTTAARCAELCGTGKDGGLYAPADWQGEAIDWVRSQLVADVELYSAWLSGQVYGFRVLDDDGEEVDDGSCWGFLPNVGELPPGDDGLEYIRQEARWDAEAERSSRLARAEARQLGWALARVARPRLEYLRGELRAERISYGELAELQGLAAHIEPGDVELLEAAGVPEFEYECDQCGETVDTEAECDAHEAEHPGHTFHLSGSRSKTGAA